MAQVLTEQDFADVKRDIDDIGDSVNEKKIIQPRYGAPYRSIPLVVENIENTISEWDSAVKTITQEGGVPALAVSDASGVTQQQINDDMYRKFDEQLQLIDLSKTVDQICARMADGQTVKIACFGDSTTDGDTTTGFTPNTVDSSGNAIASNHNLTAPNSWPVKLQELLRDMFNNSNIFVFNAGFSGKRMDNGWALDNYDRAITSNAHYGKPDICFVGFGLNDIAYSGFLNRHITQTKLLIEKILDNGTLPILLSCNAVARSEDNSRAGFKASRLIDEAKATIAAQYGIPFIDVGMAQKQWLEKNADGVRWASVQQDSLHFSDEGHRFQAGFIAKELFRDVYAFNDTNDSLAMATQDSRSNCKAIYTDYYTRANTRFKSNARFITANHNHSESVATLWVWNESPNAELIYRGIHTEGYENQTVTVPPKVVLTKQVLSTSMQFIPAGIGIASEWRQSEKPYRVDYLCYGLNKVEYRLGDSSLSASYMGYFEILKTQRGSREYANCLKNSGELVVPIPANKSGSFILPEYSDGSNIYGCDVGEYVEFYAEVTLAPLSGVILGVNSAFGTSTGVSESSWGDVSYTYVYRGSAEASLAYLGKQGTYVDGSTATYSLFGSVAFDLRNPNSKFVVRYSKVDQSQVKIEMWSNWEKSSGYVSFVHDLTSNPVHCPLAGRAGGIYYGSDTRTGTSIIHQLIKKQGKL